ncbi:hypothetical protein AnigIFM60653_008702 [Aspergillus niger]|nr:hypothetical protein AnigIFM50267_008662 [Aspergillus niger]GLA07471.1 hypothetical protein AnigIFM60653_008702 [Aspergillus niger]GLA20162.1 hypothetical protein AnigIFM62618_008296 [Aspergillus niger]
MISWHSLPAEIRILVLEALVQDGCSLAGFATVSRQWQTIIEQHNFAPIKLTLSHFDDYGLMIQRNRALVRYIWLCLELEEYDCMLCAPSTRATMQMGYRDDCLIIKAFRELFSTLSAWKLNGNLLLDFSIHSPSDSEHWFKYLTFLPDILFDKCDRNIWEDQSMLAKLEDPQHSWITGRQDRIPPSMGIDKVFEEIMGGGPFNYDEQENQGWRQLPSVPVVTSMLLRQQTRRRWKPGAWADMFARFPRLQEIIYEPWREWARTMQDLTADCECCDVSPSSA